MGADYIILYYNDSANFYVCKRTVIVGTVRQFFAAYEANGALVILAEWDGGTSYKMD